ncbi:MAG: homoserine kinase [Thermoplasmata archaeon]
MKGKPFISNNAFAEQAYLMRKVAVKAPATIANFGPGYDTFGLCLSTPYDIIEAELSDKKGIVITQKRIGKEPLRGPWRIPTDPRRNTAGVAAGELLRLSGKRTGLHITITKGISAGSGLGSSAASAVGGALATAELIGVNNRKMILAASAKGEAVSSGAPHLDNVSPCLFGGFTVVIDHEKLDVIKIVPPKMRIVICQPDIVIETYRARKLIPEHVPTRISIAHSSWASGIVHGMKSGDVELIARCLQDEIAVPARKKLIKGFDKVRRAALDAGALTFSISGSGPAVYSLALSNHSRIGEAMVEAFEKVGVKADFFVSKPGDGAKVIEKE